MPANVIREEILKSGVISFARFMELALYCPETGYYEAKKEIVGQRGDFITSVSAGSLFGELLAFQFAEWLSECGVGSAERGMDGRARREECGLSIVEAGAHDGRLAGDILGWLRAERAELFERIEYVILEPSARRREWQGETLKDFAPMVRWVSRLSELENRQSATGNRQSFSGVIFSNELLDAMPVYRFGWDAAQRAWIELGVGLDDGNFCWRKMRQAAEGIQDLCPLELKKVLPDGYVIEMSPAAEDWWTEAARTLKQGKLMTIDYGYTGEEMFLPGRTRGTLRGYQQHRVTDDVLANPGEQDLTAHVNFTAMQTAGEEVGLKTEQFCTQPQFLTRILQQAVAEKSFANLDAKRVRQFQTLTHPEHLGRAFRVLVQGRM